MIHCESCRVSGDRDALYKVGSQTLCGLCCAVYLRRARTLVDAQAEDDGLWFQAETAPEAYLQEALRKVHSAIEP